MLARLDTGEQDQMRRLLTACIASLTEPPDSSGPPDQDTWRSNGPVARGC
jgi:hypothetical protein